MVALPETTLQQEAVYKKELTHVIKTVEKYSPDYWLFNNAQNKFKISSDLQTWQQEQLLNLFKKINVNKSATVISAELIFQSAQQTPLIPSQYFTNEEDALQWLVGSVKETIS
ncbi:hypothetical protein M23134_06762 [Microscilla marina ATCC 23134]|uniref:STAS/SEC14 domain-containing protein n=2 Tax=Microscilla marina TaxID=1027 RepID=A1ZWN4_MICM2|nr:hypothetical protein M23134_06762 [Microscilla marina ATCC 23134]